MTVLDTVLADTLENGDTISLNGDTLEIISGMLTNNDPDMVAFNVHNLTTGEVETIELPFDQMVEILGE